MDRRGFLQSLAAGAAIVMLPSLAEKAVAAPIAEGVPTTAAALTNWMRASFNVFDALPAAFMEVPVKDLPTVYGFGIHDIPKDKFAENTNLDEIELVRFPHKVMCYGIEGDDPVEAERRLVAAAYEDLNGLTAAGKLPLFLRVTPTFSHERMTEYGDVWMTREDIEDRTDLQKTVEPVRDGHMMKYVEKVPEVPLAIPSNVELDWETQTLRHVKRRYTLNKLRLRLSLPTLSEEQEAAICLEEGTRPKRIS